MSLLKQVTAVCQYVIYMKIVFFLDSILTCNKGKII